MSERRPQLQEVIRRAVEANARELYTVIPAKVVKWDASKQKADCQILIKNITYSETDEREVNSWAVVTNVPVQFPGAGGYRITFPISDGNTTIDNSVAPATTGSLFYSHRSLDKWLTGDGSEVDPEFDHDHGENDCIFMPGLNPFGAPLGSCPTDHATIGHDSGQQAHFHKDSIVLGDELAAEGVVTKKDLQALYFAINAAAVVAQDGGSAFKANLLTQLGLAGWTTGTTDGQLGSSKIKAKR